MEKVKKKINLQRLSSILSEKELKNVLGGSGGSDFRFCTIHHPWGHTSYGWCASSDRAWCEATCKSQGNTCHCD